MRIERLLLLLALWAGIAWTATRLSPLGLPLDGRALAFGLLLPWVAALIAFRAGELGGAVLDGLRGGSELAAERRARSIAILRFLGSLSVAVGVVLLLAGNVAVFSTLATEHPDAGPSRILSWLGPLLASPALGLALRYFLYGPLAAALEDAPSSTASTGQ